MNRKRTIVYLAALLHRIGSFETRIEGTGRSSTRENTLNFVKKSRVLSTILDEVDRAFLISCIESKPEASFYFQMIEEAARLTLGVEGEIEQNNQPGEQLRLVFDLIEGKAENLHPLVELNLDSIQMEYQDDSNNYENLWQDFKDDWEALATNELNVFAENATRIVEKYCTNIPFDASNHPGISLYEYSRTTAAIVLCLFDVHEEQDIHPKEQENPVLMVGGDLSGIQSYIYNVIGKMAAKNLKGRSFYLQILILDVLRELRNTLSLFSSSVIYASGGGFYLLASNTKQNKLALSKLEISLTDRIWDRHENSLFLAIASITLDRKSFINGGLSASWAGLSELLARNKSSRYSKWLAIDNNFDKLFSPESLEDKYIQKRDVVDGAPLALEHEDLELDRLKSSKVNALTKIQIDLGRELRNELVALVFSLSSHGDSRVVELPSLFRRGYYQFRTKKNYAKFNGGDILEQWNINTFDFEPGAPFRQSILLYGGNTIPLNELGEPKDFEELSGVNGGTEQGKNLRRLGIVRMDVDNLGFLFKEGLKDSFCTFPVYARLSKSLDWFFTGHLNVIREQASLEDDTLILYAGGDDLFILGKWDSALKYADHIRAAFKQFTGRSKLVTISGGIVLVKGKFPIAKGADLAGDAEKQAKMHIAPSEGYEVLSKNSFCFLDRAFNWENEWPVIQQLMNTLLSLTLDKDGEVDRRNKSILKRVGQFAELKREQERTGENPSWMWLSAYDFARAKKRRKFSIEQQEKIEQIYTSIIDNNTKNKSDYHFLELLETAARWAEFELRTKN